MRKIILLAAMLAMVLATAAPAFAQMMAASGGWGIGSDLIIGSPAGDVLHGLAGDDLILGLGGNDLLTGGEGDDAVDGGPGDDRVEGNPGDDLVWGGPGDDEVLGGWGDDLVVGASGEDALRGGSGADRIEAQDGFADEISCGADSRDLVFYDRGLDSLAADCEAEVVTPQIALPKCLEIGENDVGDQSREESSDDDQRCEDF